MDMKTIGEVKQANEAELLALPDVASVGIGLDEKGSPAIVVGLARENVRTQALIPQELETYPVTVKITGQLRAQ
ncbi:MAG: hypothetical protein K9I59_07620 [Chlorobium sp.]|nr:hypothetical protein [Chlorobiaceae bacterium]MCF8217325.1 hypothetical protein [Chlorobium sp.]MCF8271537.1 hypothetical protein [Chlorobium sp.]MCF8287909.1 hypothetical protein [Chlorobium sp.]MCF8292107.1 hypothetical protein [Chlorobium sp.]